MLGSCSKPNAVLKLADPCPFGPVGARPLPLLVTFPLVLSVCADIIMSSCQDCNPFMAHKL